MEQINEIDDLWSIFQQLSFLSSKQIKKIINLLISKKNETINNLEKIQELIKELKQCSICTQYTKNEICQICSSNEREKKLLIVECVEQIKKIEDDNIFKGKYFVIPILYSKKFIPLDYDFSFLINYLPKFNEVIIGVDSTPEGILTSNRIFEEIRKKSTISVTKLATGIPLGSNIDYVDKITLSYALNNRKEIK